MTLAAYNALARTLGSDHRDTQEVVAQLLDLYSKWGKTDKAAKWRAALSDDPRTPFAVAVFDLIRKAA